VPNDRQKQLRNNIRRHTKRIGQALKAYDHNEVSNLRTQRGAFIKTLIEEFNEYFIIQNGKSRFVSLEEATTHYEDPENKKSLAVAQAVSEMYQGREFLRDRYKTLHDLTPEDAQEKVLREVSEQMERMEKMMNALLADVGRPTIDFNDADASKDTDFLDGIDMSSLL
jgi:hypothetical protein